MISLLQKIGTPTKLISIAEKVVVNQRIDTNEALQLYKEASLPLLSILADTVRQRINGNKIYFNRNIHIEPTNICENHCAFCSYRRVKGQAGSWELSIDEIVEKAKAYIGTPLTEIHIVGGVHPERDVNYYVSMIKAIKEVLPTVQIKAFTAVEIEAMCRFANVTVEKGLSMLKEAGLVSMPGGGAEIFDELLRKKICPDKADSATWLQIHRTAHQLQIPTNSTMLYGLLENYSHRIDHLNRLRTLQDETGGFNAFIPLKFKHYNNAFSHIKETTTIEDLKNYAVSRIFLDNIPHLKAYWPMIGKQVAQLSLAFGVDDLDGTIDDTTKIYSMAGADEQTPTATTDQLVAMIKDAGLQPVERDTLYNILQVL